MVVDFSALPNHSYFDTHFWVDWVELLCVANIDESVNRAAVARRVRSLKEDTGEAADAEDDKAQAAEVTDRWFARIEEWFGHLEMRQKRLKDAYPFSLSADSNQLSLKSNLTTLQKFYLLLLMASALKYFSEEESDITASFELISLEALRKLLPSGAEVHLFGANKLKKGKFEGNLWNNLNVLAKDFVERLHIKEEDAPAQNRGDNGTDLIGWVKIEEDVPGIFSVFGQCACTKNWVSKQMTSAADRWSSTMTLQTYPLNSVFIPFCQRKRDACWHSPQDMARSTLVIDRFRFLALLKTDIEALKTLPAFGAVDDLLATKEMTV